MIFTYIIKWLRVQIGLAIVFGILPLLISTQDADAYVSYSSMLSVDSNYVNTAAAAMVFYFGLLFLYRWFRGGVVEGLQSMFGSILAQGSAILSGLFKMFFWWHFSLLSLSFFSTMEIDPWFQSAQALTALGYAFLIDAAFAWVAPKGRLKAQYSGSAPEARFRPIKDVHRNELDSEC